MTEAKIGPSERRYRELTELVPGLAVFFAMKSNSAATVLRTVRALGGSFEVASAAEMRMARAAGAAPEHLLYSNPVKPPAHTPAAPPRRPPPGAEPPTGDVPAQVLSFGLRYSFRD